MKDEYDFSGGVRNPYASQLKKQTTINLNNKAVAYFKKLSAEYGVPYQTLINLYLMDCVKNERKPSFFESK